MPAFLTVKIKLILIFGQSVKTFLLPVLDF